MRSVAVFAFIVLITLQSKVALCMTLDTNRTRQFLRDLNFNFTWFELGKSFPLEEKQLANLDEGLSEYMRNIRGYDATSFFGIGTTYRDKVGVEIMYFHQGFSGEGNDFLKYLNEKYPTHYLPNTLSGYRYSLEGFGLRLLYRKHFKYIYIEPKFQFCINSFNTNYPTMRFKEIGTNQFIHYAMTPEVSGSQNSYHFMCNVVKRFKPFFGKARPEVALMGQFMISPTEQTVTIREQPYGQEAVTNAETFKTLNAAFNVSISVRVFLD